MTLNIKSSTFRDTLFPNFDLLTLKEFVKNRLAACGFDAPVEDIENNRLGYTIQLSDNVYGTVKYWLKFTNRATDISIEEYLYANENYDYDTWTEVLRSSGVKQTIYPIKANPLTIYAIPKDNQFMGLVFTESGNKFKGFMGIAYPDYLDWYDENQWIKAMLVSPNSPNIYTFPMPNPNNRANLAAKSKIEDFSLRNPDNLPQVAVGPYLTISSEGIAGKFNSQIAVSNNKGFNTSDISVKQPGVEEWWNLYCDDNGIVIRSV